MKKDREMEKQDRAPQTPEDGLTTDRRTFLTLMGASLAMAGAGASGCIRKPVEKILPFNNRPEYLVPGNPLQFATALYTGGGVLGLLVESQEGRPTKVEGNPNHPMSNPDRLDHHGRTNAWAQSSVLDLYDPDRSDTVRRGRRKASWTDFDAFATAHFGALRSAGGAGLAVLTEATPSPTLWSMLAELRESTQLPKLRLFVDDPGYPTHAVSGLGLAGATGARPLYSLNHADVLVAVDSDLLGLEGDAVRNARLFAEGRLRSTHPTQRRLARMNRLYAVEPHYTYTGLLADDRLRVSASLVGTYLLALASELKRSGLELPPEGLTSKRVDDWVGAAGPTPGAKRAGTWVREVAQDLLRHRGRSALAVGARQPAWVHALAYALNAALDNVGDGKPVSLIPDPLLPGARFPEVGTLVKLGDAIRRGEVTTLLILGGNPAYTAPPDLELPALLSKVRTSIHLSGHDDETSRRVTWHLPCSHYLERWGDLRATDGTVSIQQPLIAPLRDSRDELQVLGDLLGRRRTSHQHVRYHWRRTVGSAGFEKRWQRWVHDGVADIARPSPVSPKVDWSNLDRRLPPFGPGPKPGDLEALFTLDSSLYDGRHANNAWLQELPDTVTKLTWDNAALLSPTTAARHKVQKGDLLRLTAGKRTLDIAAWIVPGVAENVVVLPLGYGRKHGGRVARWSKGFDTYQLRSATQPHFGEPLQLRRLGRKYALATTQKHGSMVEPFTGRTRHVVRDHTLAEFAGAGFSELWNKYRLVKESHNRSLWVEPNVRTGPQWGMVIDLGRCQGCNVCTVACQAENSIPVVGKKEILNGRELHWMRVDRYFTSNRVIDPEQDPDAGAVLQPMPCQQCETAPCENVCPVGATLHSPAGLNDMAYNRCIGTRYCANNCPFKVRRFNFYGYAQKTEKMIPLLKMQRNPDVSVRFRGTMEKCTYCVQRIQEATIAAKVDDRRGGLRDGDILPACAQACPTGAITFGNLNDRRSQARLLRGGAHSYVLLEELNLHPRTSYLARISNPNPRLA
ncbi:MAG: 4Fe-4S dicluster domain-containing protein [bacterium]